MSSLSLWPRVASLEHHTFLTHELGPKAIVIDAGANVGNFAQSVVAKFGCHVHSFEPHPDHFAKIPTDSRITKVQAAVAATEGTCRLRLSDNPEASRLDSKSTDGIDVPTINLEKYALANGLTSIALLKLDIEGAELEVLDAFSDDFLSQVSQITIEFHDFAGYMTPDQVRGTIARLEKHGFAAAIFSRTGHGDTLLVNQNRIALKKHELWMLRNVVRNVLGVRRMLARKVGR